MIPISEFRKSQADELEEEIGWLNSLRERGDKEFAWLKSLYLVSLYDRELVEYMLSYKPWVYKVELAEGDYSMVMKRVYDSYKDWEEWRVQVFKEGTQRLVESHSDIDIHLLMRWIFTKLELEDKEKSWKADEPEDLPF